MRAFCCNSSSHFGRRKCRKRRQVRQRRCPRTIDLGILKKIVGTSRKVRGQLRDEFFPARNLQRIVCKALRPNRGRAFCPHGSSAERARTVRGIHLHPIRKRQQLLVQTVVEQPRKLPRSVRARKIGPSDIANKQRIAGQHRAGLPCFAFRRFRDRQTICLHP